MASSRIEDMGDEEDGIPVSGIMDFGAFSHIGKRQSNQDAVRLPDPGEPMDKRGLLFAVADGMGGHFGGERASGLACAGLSAYYERELKGGAPKDLCRHLAEAVLRTDRYIRLCGVKDERLRDMGTTLSCLVITGRHTVIGHVGDSRIYRLRNDFLTQLTVDHTFVQEMIMEGEVSPQKAHLHPLRHVLTRALGTREFLPGIDLRIDSMVKKDRFLLCTDGLYNAVLTEEIQNILSYDKDSMTIAREMVETALGNGARDNVTALVIRIKDRGDSCPITGDR